MTELPYKIKIKIQICRHDTKLTFFLVPDANPSTASGDCTNTGDGNWTNSRSGEAQTDPAAIGFAASCSQMSEAWASKRGGASLCSPTLSNHEECPQPHDTLSSWEGLSRWEHVAAATLANELHATSWVFVSSVSLLSKGPLYSAEMSGIASSLIKQQLPFRYLYPGSHFWSLCIFLCRKQCSISMLGIGYNSSLERLLSPLCKEDLISTLHLPVTQSCRIS